MIIVLKQDAPEVQVREFCHELQDMGLQINDSKGSESHILGLIGDTKAVAESWVLANPVVETCRRVTEPYKKANRKFHPDDSVIDVDGVKIGGGNFAVIAGPCSIESEEQITYCAQRVKAAGASLLRGGAFKPRTSPYSFQGMRSEGLDLLKLARRATGAPIVTEIMNTEHLPLFENVDLIQVGARNMQNFELLKAVGRQKKPVLLKRGLANTLEEFVMSAEYIMAEGNENVILCERGIRTFETSMRNTRPCRCGDAAQDDPPARYCGPQPCLRPRMDGAGSGKGRCCCRCRRPDDRGAQQPRQGKVRRCPEPDPRPVR